MSTPAKCILLLDRKLLYLPPVPAVTLLIITNFLLNEWDPAGYDEGAVFADRDLHGIALTIGGVLVISRHNNFLAHLSFLTVSSKK